MVIQRRYKELVVLMATFIGNLGFSPDAKAQGPSSFYFTTPQPKGTDYLASVPKKWRGAYTSAKDSTLRLYISSDSIYTESPVAVFSALNEAHHNGHTVLDSVIVMEDDTLPCWVHDDTVYFFLYVKRAIYVNSSDQKLFESGDFLLLSTKNDQGYWETVLFIHQGIAVEIGYFDHAEHEEEIQKKKKIKKEVKENTTVYFASFKEKEWEKMYDHDAQWFMSKSRYNKNN